MRLVAIGILAAVLGAGCALEAGDPTGGSAPRPGELNQPGSGGTPQTIRTPMIRATANPTGAASAQAVQPDPAPWDVGEPIAGSDGNDPGAAPDPAPWIPGNTLQNTKGNPPGGGTGSGSHTSSSSTPHPSRIGGHWDLKDDTSN